MISDWWTVRKISTWKSQNKTVDNYSHELLDNKHMKVFDIIFVGVIHFISLFDCTTFYQFFGCNQTGESLFVELKNSNDTCDANFTLRLKDGSCLTVPGNKFMKFNVGQQYC